MSAGRRAQIFALASALAITTLAAGTSRAAPTTAGWVLSHPSAKRMESGSWYQLFNVYNRAFLDARFGPSPSLDVAKVAPSNVEIVVRGGGPVRCGEPFTLRVRGHALVYEPSTGRIGLEADGVSDEWRVSGCKAGDVVVVDGRPIALVNTRRRDAWVGCTRIAGPPYCWDDKQLMGRATD